ncbi:MAG TPA: hypothetical protein VGG38_11670 [Acidimicrobiales bacterium]
MAESLTDALPGSDISVELFREMDIEHHPAFSAVIEEFVESGEVSRPTLLAAASAYLIEVAALQVDVVILDALFAYLPSLLAWGDTDEDIIEFLVDISELFANFDVFEVHLTGDLVAGLNRAGAREGGDWLTEQVKKISRYRNAPVIATTVDAAVYLDTLARRAIRLLEQAPWEVAFCKADRGASVVHSQAIEFLEPRLRRD